jgi:catechol 2,3-dioxygenase-like lactoylglutathione lyase family enzyme
MHKGFPGLRRYKMEQRVSMITLGVEDLERSKDFYERLGWRRCMTKADGIVFFPAGGTILALFPRDALAEDADLANDGHGFSGFSLAYNTRSREEVDSVLTEVESAGAKILKPAKNAPWGGYSGYFADPDGFAWEVAWNPFFEIAEDGRVQVPD